MNIPTPVTFRLHHQGVRHPLATRRAIATLPFDYTIKVYDPIPDILNILTTVIFRRDGPAPPSSHVRDKYPHHSNLSTLDQRNWHAQPPACGLLGDQVRNLI